MNKIKLINGWTKEKVMAQVKKYNNGKRAGRYFFNGNNYFGCLYEDEYFNRCAVGCFIPSGHIALKVGLGVYALLNTYKDLIDFMPFSPNDMIQFQTVHDNCAEGNVHDAIQKFLDEKVE